MLLRRTEAEGGGRRHDQGRSANFATMNGLLGYLTENCCGTGGMCSCLRSRRLSATTEGGGGMKRFHVHVSVEKLDESIRFYSALFGFLSPFGDITLWNILVFGVVLPYISPYSRMTNRMLWGHILSVAPETSSMAGGACFHLDTSHNRPDAFVTGCHHAAPRGVCRRCHHGTDHSARALDPDQRPLSAVRHSSPAHP